MIRLYSLDYVKDPSKFASNISEMFDVLILKQELDKREQEIIRIIDDAKYLGNYRIESRFGGLTHLSNISSGAKIALLIRWLIKNDRCDVPLNITNCGNNVFPIIIEEVGDNDVYFLTCNYTVRCLKNARILVNDQVEINCFSNLSDLVGTVIRRV